MTVKRYSLKHKDHFSLKSELETLSFREPEHWMLVKKALSLLLHLPWKITPPASPKHEVKPDLKGTTFQVDACRLGFNYNKFLHIGTSINFRIGWCIKPTNDFILIPYKSNQNLRRDSGKNDKTRPKFASGRGIYLFKFAYSLSNWPSLPLCIGWIIILTKDRLMHKSSLCLHKGWSINPSKMYISMWYKPDQNLHIDLGIKPTYAYTLRHKPDQNLQLDQAYA